MNKVKQFIEHMKEDNWIFAEGFEEQDFTFKSIADLEKECKTILEEDVDVDVKDESRDIDKKEELIPGYHYISLFLEDCTYWAELQSIIWPGIEKADKEVQDMGEQMIDVLMKLQKVDSIEELHMDT